MRLTLRLLSLYLALGVVTGVAIFLELSGDLFSGILLAIAIAILLFQEHLLSQDLKELQEGLESLSRYRRGRQ